MSEDEAAFVAAARWALLSAPPGPPGSLRALLEDDRQNPLATDEDFDRALATGRALDGAGARAFAEALRAAFPPPDTFDPTDSPRPPVVEHAEHGIGLTEPDPGRDEVRIRFVDGLRALRGPDARFSSPGRVFAQQASLLLGARVPALAEDEAWDAIEGVGWAGGAPIGTLAAALAARVPVRTVHALVARVWDLAGALEARLRAFEQHTGRGLPCSDDAFGDLVHHVIGLGRAEYAATHADPGRAERRALARDFRASFVHVLLAAAEQYPPDAVLAAMDDLAPDARIDDAELGRGFRSGGVRCFPGRAVPDPGGDPSVRRSS